MPGATRAAASLPCSILESSLIPSWAGRGKTRKGWRGVRAGRSLISDFHRQNRLHWADWFHLLPEKKDNEDSKLNIKTPSPAPAEVFPRDAAFALLKFVIPEEPPLLGPGTGPTGHRGSFWKLLTAATLETSLPKLAPKPKEWSGSFQTTKSFERWEISPSLAITKRTRWTENEIAGHISWCSFPTKHRKQCFILAKNPTYHFFKWPYFFQHTHELMTAAQGFPINDIPQHFTNTGLSCSSISSAWINLYELMLWLPHTHLPLLTCTYIPWLLVKE